MSNLWNCAQYHHKIRSSGRMVSIIVQKIVGSALPYLNFHQFFLSFWVNLPLSICLCVVPYVQLVFFFCFCALVHLGCFICFFASENLGCCLSFEPPCTCPCLCLWIFHLSLNSLLWLRHHSHKMHSLGPVRGFSVYQSCFVDWILTPPVVPTAYNGV